MMKKWIRAVLVLLVIPLISVSAKAGEEKRKVAIDPGHQGSWVDMSEQEASAPGSQEMKAKATTGTEGRYSGIPEYELNLRISLALKEELQKRGYEIVMTREDNDTAISNQERAILANESGADVCVRIHANGSDDTTVSGALTMAPSKENPYVGYLSEESTLLSQCIVDAYCEATGLKNLGVLYADNMTGTNFSTIPVTIVEMGYMSNEGDDLYMADAKNQEAMVKGIADGVDAYFSSREKEDEGKKAAGIDFSGLQEGIETSLQDFLEAGEKWSVAVVDLNSDSEMLLDGGVVMQSASVIKVFIMGAVYERAVYAAECGKELIPMNESYDGELKDLLVDMITVSDNEAANELVRRLGQGDFEAGAGVVNEFCREHGYLETHLGRMFLAENPTDDNYTSARDCADFLKELYNGTLLNVEASGKMLEILDCQTRKGKIPAGLPEEIKSANKTGEMTAGYGLGSIENDIAIVYNGRYPYVLCVLSNEIQDNGNAQAAIADISKIVYQYFSSVLR